MGCGEYFLQEKSRVKRFRELADEEKQAGIQGQWQQKSPAREYLDQVNCCNDTDCKRTNDEERLHRLEERDVGRIFFKKKTSRKVVEVSEWAFDRIKEAFELVAQDEAEKMSIVQEIMLISTDYLRRIIAPVGGQGGVTMSYLCPHCNSFPLEDYVWWVSGRKSTKWWCAICGEK